MICCYGRLSPSVGRVAGAFWADYSAVQALVGARSAALRRASWRSHWRRLKAMACTGGQITGFAGRRRIQGPPQPPAFLAPQPRAQKLRRAPQRQAATIGLPIVPMIHGAAPHLPAIPTAAHQQRRLFRIRLGAGVAQVALHPHALAPAEKPRPPRVAAVLDRQPAPARRAALPIPDCPPGQLPQRLHKDPPAFDNVHGRRWRLPVWLFHNHSMVAQPIFVKVRAAAPYQHNLEPSLLRGPIWLHFFHVGTPSAGLPGALPEGNLARRPAGRPLTPRRSPQTNR